MALTPVESSNITAVDYDADKKHLDVHFKTGAPWRYHDVPPEKHAGLMGEGVEDHSVGKYFHAHIKGAHKSTKLEED